MNRIEPDPNEWACKAHQLISSSSGEKGVCQSNMKGSISYKNIQGYISEFSDDFKFALCL